MSLDIIAQLWAAGASFAGMGRKLGVSRPWSLAESTGPRSVFLPLPVARGVSACGVCLPDLEQPRPPDLAPGLVKLPKAERNPDGGSWRDCDASVKESDFRVGGKLREFMKKARGGPLVPSRKSLCRALMQLAPSRNRRSARSQSHGQFEATQGAYLPCHAIQRPMGERQARIRP